MLIVVCAVFAICWLPLNICHIITDFGLGNYSSITFMICHWIAMSSVCYNPFIYFWLNKHYSKRAKNLFNVCLSMKCIQKSILPKSKSVNNLNKKRNNNQKLKRRNAFKVSKNVREKRLFGTMCIRGSITNTISSPDNIVEAGNSGINSNKTTTPKFIDESKL